MLPSDMSRSVTGDVRQIAALRDGAISYAGEEGPSRAVVERLEYPGAVAEAGCPHRHTVPGDSPAPLADVGDLISPVGDDRGEGDRLVELDRVGGVVRRVVVLAEERVCQVLDMVAGDVDPLPSGDEAFHAVAVAFAESVMVLVEALMAVIVVPAGIPVPVIATPNDQPRRTAQARDNRRPIRQRAGQVGRTELLM